MLQFNDLVRIMNRSLIFLSLVLLGGCYSPAHYRDPQPFVSAADLSDVRTTKIPLPQGVENPAGQVADKKPWENFSSGYDMYGNVIINRQLILGDQYYFQGLRGQALNEYQKIIPLGLSQPEIEALTIRKASALLSLDKPNDALDVLRKYYAGKQPDAVKPAFAIVFGYAYGRLANTEQALAWFSKAYNSAPPSAMALRTSAKLGVGLILGTLDEEELFKATRTWENDSFIRDSIEQEDRKRKAGLAPTTGDFLGSTTQIAINTPQQPAAVPLKASVVALLPLSGPYAALGNNTKNGISLALEGRSDGINVQFLDTRGDAAQAASYINEMAARNDSPIVIGPLLATPAQMAASSARAARIPLVALTKRDNFQTGDGIFRLGTTSKGQVESLLDECTKKLWMEKFALVYPATEGGTEYAEAFKQAASMRGLSIVYEASFHSSDSSTFRAVADALDRVEFDGVFLPADLNAAVNFSQMLSEDKRSRIALLGAAAWDDKLKLDRASKLMDGAIFVTPFYSGDSNPLVQSFINAYKLRFGVMPDFMAAQGFDAATLVVAALQHQQSSGKNFEQSLLGIDLYDGVTGKINAYGRADLKRNFAVVQYRAGKIEPLQQKATPSYTARGNSVISNDPNYGQKYQNAGNSYGNMYR